MTDLVGTIQKNIEKVKTTIHAAALAARRDPDSVRLVVVTKAQPVAVIRAAVEAGAHILGENYPEETAAKMDQIGPLPGVAWHMIGHLQSRKAGIVASRFDAFESLDNLALAQKLDRVLAEREGGRVLPVMLEFNVGGEESKHGWIAQDESRWEALLPEIEQILSLKRLAVQGLMTMPPYVSKPDANRVYFIRLRRLRDFLAAHFPAARWDELSMGTSADYPIAVQEGATLVRIGRAIVGSRPKKAAG